MTAARTDDILLTGLNDEDHLDHLAQVLQILEVNGITVRMDKCKFFMDEVENLGHIICKDGIKINPAKYEAVTHAPPPKNIKELQSFIGGINY